MGIPGFKEIKKIKKLVRINFFEMRESSRNEPYDQLWYLVEQKVEPQGNALITKVKVPKQDTLFGGKRVITKVKTGSIKRTKKYGARESLQPGTMALAKDEDSKTSLGRSAK